MKGFVPTPQDLVDMMVSRLFAGRHPTANTTVLDPGCGNGEFITGIIRWCRENDVPFPRIVGIELDPDRSRTAAARFSRFDSIRIITDDFLRYNGEPFDFIVGNPPYVPITELDEVEKREYRDRFRTASGRFDLYFLFWEKALSLLKPSGRLVYVTPEKYLTVASARPLRRLLAAHSVPEIILRPENTFPGLITYPTVTVVEKRPGGRMSLLRLRDGTTREAFLSAEGASLAASLYGNGTQHLHGIPLRDLCARISCGVATGADRVFVHGRTDLFAGIPEHAFPTISGRQLAVQDGDTAMTSDTILVPYDRRGKLLRFSDLNGLGTFLSSHRSRLENRTCVERKPWYAFHETPPMEHLLRPKILCRDVTDEPQFWKDVTGEIIPRHSVYYLVPRNPEILDDLLEYLNGEDAGTWLRSHCQRAASGYLRLQSAVLKMLPVPEDLVDCQCPELMIA